MQVTTPSKTQVFLFRDERIFFKTMQLRKCLAARLQIRKFKKAHLLQISLRGNLMIFIANTTIKVTYRKLAIHFSQGKSSQ